ncbi:MULTISPECIES: cytochrome P450 [Actinoalloteichus]|uniref:cytochrome P450 n=1 Tax=Actinoalloteichus TaxID=65496 RepID=UPI00095040CD|nr:MULTISPECIES: cytochrome P450 [Actinoalloteichus]APU21544.1 hypothetical protein UA75_17770 [Actinoalloteichus sp. GBA129-24]
MRFRPPGTRGDATPVLERPELRRLFRQALSSQAADAQRQHAAEAAQRFLSRLRRQGPPMDLHTAIALPLPFEMSGRALLGDLSPRLRRRLHADALIGLNGAAYSRDDIETAWLDYHRSFTDWYANPVHLTGDHLMARFQRAAEGMLSPHELAEIAGMLWAAGHESTVGFLTNASLALLSHPDVWNELRDRPELIPQSVDELLRYTPLATGGAPRRAVEDADIAGLCLARGDCAVFSYLFFVGQGEADDARLPCGGKDPARDAGDAVGECSSGIARPDDSRQPITDPASGRSAAPSLTRRHPLPHPAPQPSGLPTRARHHESAAPSGPANT